MKSADNMMLYKYIIRNTAAQYGKTVTFMPKPLFGDNGSGMHTHQSIWKDGKPLFAGDGYAGLSQMALYYIGGLLKHARALSAIIAPTTNSYKRLVPGYEAPVNLAYSRRNRSAACRIPMYSASPKAKRVEFRPPDPSCNPYLAFAAMLMAGLDGVLNKIDPGEPLDKDIYDLSPEEMKAVPSMPASLEEALSCLEEDHAVPAEGRRLQRGTDRDLHRLQAQERSGCHPPASASVRVRAVLRHLSLRLPIGIIRCQLSAPRSAIIIFFPAFGFREGRPPLRAVGMWKSRAVCEISKGRWKEWESFFAFPLFPRTRHFHRPPCPHHPTCGTQSRLRYHSMYRNPGETGSGPDRDSGRVLHGRHQVVSIESDTPREAGGLMSWAASKAVGLVGLGVARCAPYWLVQNCPPAPSAASCSRMYVRTCSSSNPTVDTA